MLDPDIFRRTGVATLLRWRIENGSRKNIIAEVGVVLVSPKNYVIPRAFSLTEPCSNSVGEYNALLIGMQIADEIGVKNLEAYGNLIEGKSRTKSVCFKIKIYNVCALASSILPL